MRQNGYVIIEGNIGAGKSTFAHALVTVFKANGLKAQLLSEPDETNNPFLPLYYSDPKRWVLYNADTPAVQALRDDAIRTAWSTIWIRMVCHG